MTSTEDDVVAGRYRLVERIGVGAMGEVWRARDLTLQRNVAVKRVRLGGHLDPAAEARFQREAVAMAGVSHPNVVIVYDAGTDTTAEGETAYLVMELLEGPSCSEVIASGRPLDFAEIARIGAGVAHGLAAAHAAGVVHRDIKPGNVVISREVPTIVDFGIARLEQETTATLTAPQTTIGTAAYMSPEQALGQHVGPASDVYSLGALLMALATGSPPFGASNSLALMRAHIDDVPPPLSDRRPDAPARIVELVERMLVKEPAARPTAAEVAAVLLGGELPPTVPVPVPLAAAGPPAAAPAAASAPGRTTEELAHVAEPTAPSESPVPSAAAARGLRRRTRLIGALITLLVLGVAAVIALNLLGDNGSGQAGDGQAGDPATPTQGPTERIISPTSTDGVTTPPATEQATGPGETTPAETAGETLEGAVAETSAAIGAVANPGARDELAREWQAASSGLQGANAEGHLEDVIESAEDLADDGEVTPAELDAIRSAIDRVIARLP